MMAAALLCTMIGNLSLSPDRSQFFPMGEFLVSCPFGSGPWSVFRNTSFQPSPRACAPPWGAPREQSCVVDELRHTDSGLYWCQSKECRSEAVRITVSERKVILESPFFPVKEGQDVTLSCSYRAEEQPNPTSDFKAAFYRNDVFQGSFPGGRMVLSSVSKAHEGMYKCEHPSKEQSLESRLIVLQEERPSTIASPTSPPPPQPKSISLLRILIFVFLFLLYTAIFCIGLCIYRTWARAQAEEKKQELERVSLRRIRRP